jgi:cobalt-zinc-cadmium efflux system membrane fusion protein
VGRALVVRSPIHGRVIDVAVAPGEFKNDPNAVLMTVADLSNVWVTANVQEKDIAKVKLGEQAKAVLVAYPGEEFAGQVSYVADLLDTETRTIKVRVALPNLEGRLKPGMFATVTFSSKAAPELVVPTRALVLLGNDTVVFAEVSPWTFERRTIEVAEQQGGLAVVSRGLSAGNRVVDKNAVLLQ